MGESEHAHRQNANGTFNSRKAAHGGWSAVACHNSRDTTRRPDCCATDGSRQMSWTPKHLHINGSQRGTHMTWIHTVSLRFGVVLISPTAAKILDDSSGTVEGKAALRSYFKRGLELYPNLYFELLDLAIYHSPRAGLLDGGPLSGQITR